MKALEMLYMSGKKIPMEKHSSLFVKSLNDEDKSLVTLTTFTFFSDVHNM